MGKSAPLICSAASAGSHTPSKDSAQPELFGQLPSVSKTPTPSASSASTGPIRPSTTMSEPSTQMDLEKSTLSVVGFHASPGVSPGSKEAQKMTAISGQRWLPLLKTYGLSGSLAKTCAALLVSQWASSAVYLTWRGLGTKPFHLLFQLAPSTPRTEGTGSGLWPTVRTVSVPESPEHWLERKEKFKQGESNFNPGLNLEVAVQIHGVTNGSLNPTWVEWLMGFPIGWTDLNASETPSCRKSSSKSDGQLLKDGSDDLS
jgi:hypothetical protein